MSESDAGEVRNVNHFDWIDSLCVPELRVELNRRSLDSTGLKAVLQQRLRNFLMYGSAETRVATALDEQSVIDRREQGTSPFQLPIEPEVLFSVPNQTRSRQDLDQIRRVDSMEELIDLREPVLRRGNCNRSTTTDTDRVRFRPNETEYSVQEPARESTFHPRSVPEHAIPPVRSSRFSMTSEQIYIQEKVRGWNLKFDGKTEPESFIERLFELQESYEFTDAELFKALPELFTKDALVWYRNNKKNFQSWEDFLEQWADYYLPTDYLDRLEEQISRTKQGPEEKGRTFVAHMQTKMRRHGQYSKTKEYTIIYSNLRAEYRQYIRKSDVTSIGCLIKLIDEFEKLKTELEYEQLKKIKIADPEQSVTKTKPLQVPSSPTNRKIFRCYFCQKPGHMQRDCYRFKREQGNEQRVVVPRGSDHQNPN